MQLEAGHHRDSQLHVRMRARPLREDLAEHVRDGGPGGQVRVVLLRPDAQRRAARRRGPTRTGVTSASESPGTAARGQGRGQGEGRDHRRPATSRYTGFVTATGSRPRRARGRAGSRPSRSSARNATGALAVIAAESTTTPSCTRSTRPPASAKGRPDLDAGGGPARHRERVADARLRLAARGRSARAAASRPSIITTTRPARIASRIAALRELGRPHAHAGDRRSGDRAGASPTTRGPRCGAATAAASPRGRRRPPRSAAVRRP